MASKELSILLLAKDMASKTIKGVNKELSGLGKTGAIASKGLKVAAATVAGVGVVAAGIVGKSVASGIESLVELESAVASVDGAITTLGLTGKVTGKQVADWANEIEAATGAAFDDKAIVAATSRLLRYGKVAPKSLRPAMEVMTDLAAKTGSVESAADLLAKALADPTRAAGKLARAGVVLTKQQQDQIKAMVEAGDAAGAQALLLAELEKTTKGAAAATQGPYKRAMSTLADVVEDAQRALAEGFLPVIEEAATWLRTKLADPKVIADIREFGKGLAGAFRNVLKFAQEIPWGTVVDGLKAAAGFARTLIDAFTSMPKEVQATIIALAGLNKLTGGAVSGIVGELGKGLIKGVLGMTAGVVNINAAVVNGGGGLPGVGGKPGDVVSTGVKAGGATAALAAGGIATIAALGAAAAITAIESNNVKYGGKGLTEAEIRALKWSKMSEEERAVSRKRGYGEQSNQAALLASALAKLDRKPVVLGPPTPGYAALMERITAAGGKPTAERVRAIMEKNAATTAAAIRAGDERTAARIGSLNSAINATTAAVGRIKVNPHVGVVVNVSQTVSVRDQVIATRRRYSYQGGSTASGVVVAS